MTDMQQIEAQTRAYAEARSALTEHVRALQAEIDAARGRHIEAIRAAVRDCADQHDRLHAALSQAPHLFERPKTQTFSGVRVGWQKQRGKVEIPDEAKTIARIRAQLPTAQADLLIRVTERVHKPGVYDLTAADLRRLGITITDDTEIVTIKPVDGEVDKLVDALLAEVEQPQEAAA